MKNKYIVLIILSLILIIGPFFINIYSIYKLISLSLGIILLDVCFALNKKVNIFFLIYLPVLLIIFTYGIDYLKTYTLNLSPIYIFENKINDDMSVYNSLFYRIYKCNDKYVFDNQYKKNFMCDTLIIDNIDINKLLNEPKESYKNYKHDFIKVTGKISKISGTSSILMQAYSEIDGSVNGHVKFNETSMLKVDINDLDISNYRIYDYITIVGLLNEFNENTGVLSLIDTKIEENNLYDNYDIQVIESNKCDLELKEYTDKYYLYCIDKVFLDYGIDKYELSYALKDKRITFEKLIENIELETADNYNVYKLEKFNILSCNKEKNILISKDEKIDYSLCEE